MTVSICTVDFTPKEKKFNNYILRRCFLCESKLCFYFRNAKNKIFPDWYTNTHIHKYITRMATCGGISPISEDDAIATFFTITTNESLARIFKLVSKIHVDRFFTNAIIFKNKQKRFFTRYATT